METQTEQNKTEQVLIYSDIVIKEDLHNFILEKFKGVFA